MIEIEGTTITIVKGDSAIINVEAFNPDGSAYQPEEGDVIRFAVKKSYHDAEPVLVVNIPVETMELYLTKEDTKQLDSGYINGSYFYDIELSKLDGTDDTFIPNGKLFVREEVM